MLFPLRFGNWEFFDIQRVRLKFLPTFSGECCIKLRSMEYLGIALNFRPLKTTLLQVQVVFIEVAMKIRKRRFSQIR